MKKLIIDVTEFNKEVVTTAIETGAYAVIANKDDTEKIRKLGIIKIISENGDIIPGKDILFTNISNKEDEEKAMETVKQTPIVATIKNWKIIPLEDLIASNSSNVYTYINSVKEAEVALNILEIGVAGLVLKTQDLNLIKEIKALITKKSEKLNLVNAKITEIRQLGMSDRVCIDTTQNMKLGEGMLVGDTSSGYLLVHSETVETPYCAPRPFRVNAGAVHAYIKVANGKTKYLSDLKTGDDLIIVDYKGNSRPVNLGRAKIEQRPMMLVKAECNGKSISLILQNAETIRLTKSNGEAVSIIKLKPGDEVLGFTEEGGRHFGQKINETITEK